MKETSVYNLKQAALQLNKIQTFITYNFSLEESRLDFSCLFGLCIWYLYAICSIYTCQALKKQTCGKNKKMVQIVKLWSRSILRHISDAFKFIPFSPIQIPGANTKFGLSTTNHQPPSKLFLGSKSLITYFMTSNGTLGIT